MKHFSRILLCIFLTSCTGQALQQTYDAQEKKIDSFIEAQTRGVENAHVEYNGGSVRLVVQEGTGETTLSPKGTVSFYYAGYVFSGSSVSNSNLFATNRKEVADGAGWTLSDESIFAVETVSLEDGNLIKGLQNGLVGVREGEECWILFSGKYGFGKKAIGTVPSKSAQIYHIWVESISND